MEKNNKTQGTKRLWVSKLKNRNAKMLKEIMIKGTVELKEEILEMYEKLKEEWCEKDISKGEKKEVEEFLSIEMKIEEVSPNWIKVKYHVNEKGEEDIWEYLDGEFVWEQLFTRDVAKREIGKIEWMEMIKYEQWEKIIKECWWDIEWQWRKENWNTVDKLWKKFCGFRSPYDGKFLNIVLASNYWLPQSRDDTARYIKFNDNGWLNNRFNRSLGFSVRCVS